jgi:hypothetical protein
MIDRIDHKIQGDGTDSWWIYFTDPDRLPELVFVDPGTAEIYAEKLKYEQRAKDGMGAYLKLMAEFRVANTPREVNRHLENELETVRNEVSNGQWISALEKLDDITPQGHLTQEIYDKIHLSLTTYIDNNY